VHSSRRASSKGNFRRIFECQTLRESATVLRFRNCSRQTGSDSNSSEATWEVVRIDSESHQVRPEGPTSESDNQPPETIGTSAHVDYYLRPGYFRTIEKPPCLVRQQMSFNLMAHAILHGNPVATSIERKCSELQSIFDFRNTSCGSQIPRKESPVRLWLHFANPQPFATLCFVICSLASRHSCLARSAMQDETESSARFASSGRLGTTISLSGFRLTLS
jgi:hypothetical protein